MQHRDAWNCFIIGEGTLPIRCAEVLLDRGVKINGLISSDPMIRHWAKQNEMPFTDPSEDLVAFMEWKPCDYLFSIVNRHVLPRELLALPRRYAINYHDALLPRYAGSHATSWAILNRESMHGITWHVMGEQVDAGDILRQCRVEIAAGETALTLNAKCYEAALDVFAALADDLCHRRVSRTKQNSEERTFFPRYKRPPAGCVLSWNRCAYDIDALVRALDFGPYPNPLGLPKLAVERDFILIRKTEVLDSAPETPPGTITSINGESLRVSTMDREIALREFLTMEGQALSIPEAVKRFRLHEGYRFRDLDPESARCITELNASICSREAFWVERLETLQPLALPYAAQNGSPGQPIRHASVALPVPQEVIRFLTARQPSWPLSDFLLAAFAVYLARIGQAHRFDIEYGAPQLRRELAGLEVLFAPRVPLRLEIDAAQDFTAAFLKVRAEVELTGRHKTYACDVVARYPALRSLSERQRKLALPVTVERVVTSDNYQAIPGSEFTLVIPEDGSECQWVYDASVFDKDSITRMLRQFTVLLRGIVADPNRRIADLPLMPEMERHQLLVEWNDTRSNYPKDQCIHQLFEAQVERTPDAIAILFPSAGSGHGEHQQLTYRELNRRANQLAHYLRSLGVGAETLVGICMERSLEMVIGLLGTLKAGGAYLPLDPANPRERLTFMLQDSQVSVLLTQQSLRENHPKTVARVVCLDTDWKNIAQERVENAQSGATPDKLAYVIYTSGSTGTPKGVEVLHRGISRLLLGVEYVRLDANHTFLHLAPTSFDASTFEIWGALLHGAKCVLFPGNLISPHELTEVIRTYGISTLWLTASLFNAVIDRAPEALAGVQQLLIGGEALSVAHVKAALLLLPETQIINGYGPTESTTFACCYPIPSQLDASITSIPIGRPIANTEVYLLDARLSPVPIGIAGELCIGGDGLAQGYLNRPELTAEKFIAHPFSSEPGARLYKTGDLARYLSDGNIEFLGRLDHQVKIRGFRIELEEIETVLKRHPAVRETVVLAREEVENPKSETENSKSAIPNSQCSVKRLVAYVVPNREQPPTTGVLRQFLEAQLPDYMIPSAFVFLDALPLTPAHKIDHRSLPAPDSLRPQLPVAYRSPKTDLERKLVEIWQETLGIEKVGVRDNFFDLGGDSLLLVQVQNQLREFLNREISIIDMFRHPTISSLINKLNHGHNEQPRFGSVHDRAKRQKEAFARRKQLSERRMSRE